MCCCRSTEDGLPGLVGGLSTRLEDSDFGVVEKSGIEMEG